MYIDNYFVYYCYYDYYHCYYAYYYYCYTIFRGLHGWLVTKTPCPLLLFMIRPVALLCQAALFCYVVGLLQKPRVCCYFLCLDLIEMVDPHIATLALTLFVFVQSCLKKRVCSKS